MAVSTSERAAGADGHGFPRRPLLGASVAVFRNGRVMLAARGKAPMAGLFSLPGGRVEFGETLGEAALRELREETGVEAALIGFLAPVEVIERDVRGRVRLHAVIAAHAARWLGGEPRAGPEAREIRWIAEDEIDSLPTTPGLPGVLAQAFALARREGLA
jgi:8-oxo-dGTP diphosphatase